MGKRKRERAARGADPAATPSDEASPVGGAPTSARTAVLVALFLGAQLAIPASYYFRDDPTDERFAWRMFSAIRVQECSVSVDDLVGDAASPSPRRVDLGRTIHKAWETTLERNRRAVVDKLLAMRCREDGVVAARFERTCRSASGASLAPETVERRCDERRRTP